MPPTDLTAHLAPLSDLLAAFNHRHKNQHRRSAWWPHFNLLRRSVRRVLHASSNPKTGPQKPAALDGLSRHARWAVEHVIPPAYVAFTQLTADNQFAPLGLLLLGALARFNVAISPLLPTLNPPPSVTDRSQEVSNRPFVPVSASATDLGESISREDFPVPTDSQGKVTELMSLELKKATPVRAKAVAPTREAWDEDKVKKKKKKKKTKPTAGTDLSDLFSSLA